MMASGAESHALAAGAGAPPPSVSPVAAKRAAPAWKRPDGSVPTVFDELGIPFIDAKSWPALPGQASPPPQAKPSPKTAPTPTSTVAVISPLSLVNSGASDTKFDHDGLVISPPVRHALVMTEWDGLEKRAFGPELSPVYSPNARGNGGRDHRQNDRFGSHPHARGGGNRRGNGGGGSRHVQEHHVDFDGQRRGGVGRRDGHGPGHQQRGHHPWYIRGSPIPITATAPPPPPLPFVNPGVSHASPYGAPMGFPKMPPQYYYFAVPPSDGLQALPFVPYPVTPSAMVISPSDHLRHELLRQIEYYFSDDNLCKDIYLRQHMDEQGWVPLSLVAGFRQVKILVERIALIKKLTNSLQFILDTILQSALVEVQGERIRKRTGWETWPLTNSISVGNSPGSLSPVTSNVDSVASQLQSVGLEGATCQLTNSISVGNSPGSLSPVTSNIDSLASQLQSVGLEGATCHTSMQGIPNEAILTRSATSASDYQLSSLGGPQNNRSGPIFGQNTSRSLLRSDTF